MDGQLLENIMVVSSFQLWLPSPILSVNGRLHIQVYCQQLPVTNKGSL